MGSGPAHHAHVGIYPVPLQPAAVHDPVIGGDVLLVGDLEALGVAVKGVGVLHDELTGPEHPRPGAGLVTLLDLEVVEDQRQIPVGTDARGHVRGDDLLVGHGQDHVGAAAVVELEQLLDAVPAAPSPQVGRLQDRHEHLLAADRVHLLAHDLHDPLVHAPAGGQPAPQSGSDLAHQARPDHQDVAQRLGISGSLALSG
jgi:hypothetical protein